MCRRYSERCMLRELCPKWGPFPALRLVESFLLEKDWCMSWVEVKEEFSQEKLHSSRVALGC